MAVRHSPESGAIPLSVPSVLLEATGKSQPSKSAMSVCSERLMRTRLCPEALASAEMRLVLPTPGLPSSKMDWGSCSARITRT